jgi:plastocyanin
VSGRARGRRFDLNDLDFVLDRRLREAALTRRWKRSGVTLAVVAGALVVAVAVALPLAVASGPGSSARTVARGTAGCGATVKVSDHVKYVINRYVQDAMRFAPGIVRVKSGCRLTFEFARPGQSEPHSLSVVKQSDLPKTTSQIERCNVCRHIGAKHVKDPGRPPGPTNPIAHWIVNAGKPGFDGPGDSVVIAEAKGVPSGHQRVTVTVSARAGTTLRFICGLHPWMQGAIAVT